MNYIANALQSLLCSSTANGTAHSNKRARKDSISTATGVSVAPQQPSTTAAGHRTWSLELPLGRLKPLRSESRSCCSVSLDPQATMPVAGPSAAVKPSAAAVDSLTAPGQRTHRRAGRNLSDVLQAPSASANQHHQHHQATHMDWEQEGLLQLRPNPLQHQLQPQRQQQHRPSQVPRLPSIGMRAAGAGGGCAATAHATSAYKRPLPHSGGDGDPFEFKCSDDGDDGSDEDEDASGEESRDDVDGDMAGGHGTRRPHYEGGRLPLRPRNNTEAPNSGWHVQPAMAGRLVVPAHDPPVYPKPQPQPSNRFVRLQQPQPQHNSQAPPNAGAWRSSDSFMLMPPPALAAASGAGYMDPAAAPGQGPALALAPRSSWRSSLVPQLTAATPHTRPLPPAASSTLPAEAFLAAAAGCPELLSALSTLQHRNLLPIPGDLIYSLAHMYVICKRATSPTNSDRGSQVTPSAATGAGCDAGPTRLKRRLGEPDWMLTVLWVVEAVSSQYRCALSEVLPTYLGGDDGSGVGGSRLSSQSEAWWRARLLGNQMELLAACGWSVTASVEEMAVAVRELLQAGGGASATLASSLSPSPVVTAFDRPQSATPPAQQPFSVTSLLGGSNSSKSSGGCGTGGIAHWFRLRPPPGAPPPLCRSLSAPSPPHIRPAVVATGPAPGPLAALVQRVEEGVVRRVSTARAAAAKATAATKATAAPGRRWDVNNDEIKDLMAEQCAAASVWAC